MKSSSTPLQSIAVEKANCEKAFEGVVIGSYAWHCHHDRLVDILYEPPQDRIDYIVKEKPLAEQALRLRLFRPVSKTAAAIIQPHVGDALHRVGITPRPSVGVVSFIVPWTIPALRSHHARECPDCPWDGNTIFPPAKRDAPHLAQ